MHTIPYTGANGRSNGCNACAVRSEGRRARDIVLALAGRILAEPRDRVCRRVVEDLAAGVEAFDQPELHHAETHVLMYGTDGRRRRLRVAGEANVECLHVHERGECWLKWQSDPKHPLYGQRGAYKARLEQHAAAEALTAARALALPVQMRFRARRRRAKARREALLLGEVDAILEEAARRLAK